MKTATPNFEFLAQLVRLMNHNAKLVESMDLKQAELQILERFRTAPLLLLDPFGTAEDRTHGAQRGFLLDPSRNKWAICGNRAGKTKIGLYEDGCDLFGLQPITLGPSQRFKKPIQMWIVSDTEEASIEIAQRTFVSELLGEDTTGPMWDLVHDSVEYDPDRGFKGNIFRTTYGSRCTFKYSSQGRGAMQGVPIDKIHLDEEQPQDIYRECRTRLIDRRGYLLGTMTPVYEKSKGISWVHKELYVPRRRRRISFHNWSLLDNPYLSKEAKEEIISEWDEDEINLRVYGLFVPMGVKLAIPSKQIRRMRKHATVPKEVGWLNWKDGRPAFQGIPHKTSREAVEDFYEDTGFAGSEF